MQTYQKRLCYENSRNTESTRETFNKAFVSKSVQRVAQTLLVLTLALHTQVLYAMPHTKCDASELDSLLSDSTPKDPDVVEPTKAEPGEVIVADNKVVADPKKPQDPKDPQDPQDPKDPQDPQDPQDPKNPEHNVSVLYYAHGGTILLSLNNSIYTLRGSLKKSQETLEQYQARAKEEGEIGFFQIKLGASQKEFKKLNAYLEKHEGDFMTKSCARNACGLLSSTGLVRVPFPFKFTHALSYAYLKMLDRVPFLRTVQDVDYFGTRKMGDQTFMALKVTGQIGAGAAAVVMPVVIYLLISSYEDQKKTQQDQLDELRIK